MLHVICIGISYHIVLLCIRLYKSHLYQHNTQLHKQLNETQRQLSHMTHQYNDAIRLLRHAIDVGHELKKDNSRLLEIAQDASILSLFEDRVCRVCHAPILLTASGCSHVQIGRKLVNCCTYI